MNKKVLIAVTVLIIIFIGLVIGGFFLGIFKLPKNEIITNTTNEATSISNPATQEVKQTNTAPTINIDGGEISTEASWTAQASETSLDNNITDGATVIDDPSGPTNVYYINTPYVELKSDATTTSKTLVKMPMYTFVDYLENKNIEKTNWTKIGYNGEGQYYTGWIKTAYLAKNLYDLLGNDYKNLDFNPQTKPKDYPGNPRVKVRGIYLTIYSMSSRDRINSYIEFAKRNNINAFVIDVKNDNGYMFYTSKAAAKYCPKANEYKIYDENEIKDIIKLLRDNKIYLIARIVSFKDPLYAELYPGKAITYRDSGKIFTNSDNMSWVSAYDRTLWEYNIAVSKEAATLGFNEIQFDYVRFPASDGGKMDKMLDYKNTMNESKPEVIQKYLKFARKELDPLKVYISADVFGLVPTAVDDVQLGQHWETISNVVDYICPMMYPSHYAYGSFGIKFPDAAPYKLIYYSAGDAVRRNRNIKTPSIVRPWIQAFSAPWVKGHITYSAKEVAEQIRALKDVGVDEFLLWNASNKYYEGL